MQGLNFIAIDFETATGRRASVCEAGICVVRDGKVVETHSWLVRPQGNMYYYWNTQIHGIHPSDILLSRKCGMKSWSMSSGVPCSWRTMPLST